MTAVGSKKVNATGRSTGRRKIGKRSKIEGVFVARLVEMTESPGFRILSRASHQVLARIEIEFCHHGGTDNGRLPVTFNQFVEYGIHRHSIGPAIRELEALGFVEVTERGRSGNGEFRRPNLFRLTYIYGSNTNPTHDWRRVDTKEEALRISKRARENHSRSNRPPG